MRAVWSASWRTRVSRTPADGGGSVLVVGSINADVTVRLARFPEPGETVLADGAVEACGGKGANQAVAAARAGAAVTMAGAVGADDRGRAQLEALAAAGVSTDLVRVEPGAPTGLAVVTLTADGQNSIVVVPGANALVQLPQAGADVVVAQAEIPVSTVDSLLTLDGRLVLNLAPFAELAPRTLARSDPLVVNEGEAAALLRSLDARMPSDARGLAEAVRSVTRARSVVVTLGAEGAVLAGPDGLESFPAPRVKVVDTTGAGDAFVGTLAAGLAAGAALGDACAQAIVAASAAVSRRGAR